ncbi:hypothetical protein RJT34_23289 [Clitoria ternatea]|uniref:Uncharacterized protein n=1 Tax=Clitoria ternatea TaxID=43366 RepID=A0AAN9FSI5_CLITE
MMSLSNNFKLTKTIQFLILFIMENTRMKELTSNVKHLLSDIKRLLEITEARDKENATRFETIKLAVDEFIKHRSPVESNSSLSSQLFQV